MFSIFKKKQASVPIDFSALKTDMHSHVLPGIDDGAPDSAASLELIKGLQDLGYEKLVATPHIMRDMYNNDAKNINGVRRMMEDHLSKNHVDMPLRAAAEYFMDDHFGNLLTKNTPLLTIHGDKVLVEFSFVTTPIDYKNQFFQMQINGYQPILAHPERYTYLWNQRGIFEELKTMGILFQMNLLSLTGYYGRPTQEIAQYLIKRDFINLVGTDLHHMRHLEALRHSDAIGDSINRMLDRGSLLNPTL